MAGIRLIVILCVLLMSSDSISENFFHSFPYASRITSFKGSCNSKQCALTSKFNFSFFLVVVWYLLLTSGDIEINPGPIVPYEPMMKELKLFDSRIKILHQNARSLAGQHLLLKELIEDIGYNCIFAFSETWLSQNHPEEFWLVDKQSFDCFREDRIQTTKTKGGGIIMYIPKLLKLRLGDDLNCFPDANFESLWFDLSIQNKKCVLNLSYCPEKKTCKDVFWDKLVLGIDLAMAEGKSVILAGDYNLNYFAKRDRNLLQSIISPYDLKPSNIDTATWMTNSSSFLIDCIITDD